MLARPALRRMMGHRRLDPDRIWSRVADVDFRSPARRQDPPRACQRQRSADDGRFHVRPVGAQGSHQLAATATRRRDGVVPDGPGVPAAVDVADVLLTAESVHGIRDRRGEVSNTLAGCRRISSIRSGA